MAESVVLTTKKRDGIGSRASMKYRKQGLVPAIIYGHKEAPAAVTLSAEDLLAAVRHGARVVDLHPEGGPVQKALIRDLQWDHLGKDILHVDFARVSADERIHVNVTIELRGLAPGVNSGGVLEQPLHALPVECLAIAVPESIRINVGELQLGGAIHVRELKFPEGVVCLADPDAVVVHVTTPQAEEEAPAVEGGGAEPEVIGRKAAEEAAEEEKK
jgi:large subunit ribosomal protein L25